MSDRAFVDTNVLVYLFDVREPRKREVARQLLGSGGHSGDLVISTQVMAEFYVVLTRKLKPAISAQDAEETLRALSTWPVVQTDTELVLAAVARQRADRISLWDALIVEAAIAADCPRLYTEDLQQGRRYGPVEAVNPFAG